MRWRLNLSTRQRWLLAFVLLAAAVGILWWIIGLGNPNITRANFDRLKLDMPRADVETILGSPGLEGHDSRWRHWLRVVTRQPTEWQILGLMESPRDVVRSKGRNWYTMNTWISVSFDEQDRLCAALFATTFDPGK